MTSPAVVISRGVTEDSGHGRLGAAQLFSIVAILALAFALRCLFLNKQSLWVDEFFTIYWSRFDPGFLLGPGARLETNPPTYYLLMHTWTRLFGTSELSVRFPSVLASAATVWVVYALSRKLFDHRTAVLAALFAALEPAAVYYAQEARSYALLAFTDALALYALAGYADDVVVRGVRQWPWVALFVSAAVGAIFVHYASVVFVAACFATICLYLISTRPFPVRELWLWCAAGLATVVCSSPVLVLASGVAASPGISWISSPSRWAIEDFLTEQLSVSVPPRSTATLLLGAPLVAIFCSALFRFRLNRVQLGLLVLLPAIFCDIVVGVSFSRPLLLPRTAVWLTTPLCVLLARAATVQPTAWRRAAVVATALAVFIGALAQYFWSYHKEDWRTAAHLAAAEPQCSGPIIFVQEYGAGLTYYQPRLASRPLILLKTEWDLRTPAYALASRLPHTEILPVSELGSFLKDHPYSVLALRGPRRPLLDSLGPPRLRAELGGGVTVSCF